MVIQGEGGRADGFAGAAAVWLRQPDGEFFARPEWLKVDPTPGWNKALVIVYDCKGHRHIFTAGEGGKVNLAELRAVEM